MKVAPQPSYHPRAMDASSRQTPPATRHDWRFFRTGGFDQVRIDRAQDLRQLDTLDQKLWAVLACPSSGLEFDSRTLELLDTNREGHVGATEIREAARFVCAALRDPGLIFEPGDSVELTDGYLTWWSYIPHFIGTPGYVYAYAYGQLLALSVYARYTERGESFVPAYLELLRSGGSAEPEALGRIVDCDLGDPAFWSAGLQLIDDQLATATDAARDAGRIPAT